MFQWLDTLSRRSPIMAAAVVIGGVVGIVWAFKTFSK